MKEAWNRLENNEIQIKQDKSVARQVVEWVALIAGVLVIALLLKHFVFEVVRVEGTSMMPTMENGDRLYMDKLVLRFDDLERGDIVECYYRKYDELRYGERTYTYIKRVIALPGDQVRIDGSKLYINGELWDESYLGERMDSVDMLPGEEPWEFTVPEGQYFLMGDNRANSTDSRMEAVGFIPRKDIIGRGVFRIFPFNRFGGWA